MSRTSSKSLLATDTTKASRDRKVRADRSRRARKLGMWTLAGAGIVGLGFAVATTIGPSVGPAGSDLVADGGEETVQLLLDGWSLRTLEERQVTATWNGGDTHQVTFSPVTAADLDELLETSPAVVETSLARLLDGATTLSCDAEGCSSDGKPLNAHELLLDGSLPATLALQAHGIESGLWKAEMAVPDDGQTVTISADGYDGADLPVGGGFLSQDSDADAAPAAPTLGNGFQRDRWLLAAGLGQVFTPDAGWLGAEEDRGALFAPVVDATPASAAAIVSASAPEVVAVSGLGVPLAAAGDWTASQLTLATSPSKGCAAGVLCFPGTLDVTQVSAGPQFVNVSSAEGTGAVIFDDRTVSVDLPAPIVQAGVAEPLAGVVSLRFVTVALFAGAGLPAVDWAGLVEVGDTGAYGPADALAAVRLAGQQWAVAN